MVDGLGIPLVFVGNDVKAAALAEATTGALVGIDPGLYLNLGTGIAAALVVGGVVVQGGHRASGEIGYAVIGATGDIDWTGKGAPLEELMGGRGLGSAPRTASAPMAPPVPFSTWRGATPRRPLLSARASTSWPGISSPACCCSIRSASWSVVG